jgi:hypothetical protein
MNDYTYPTIYFSYFLFALLAVGAGYFFVRSIKDGYLGKNSEEPKYRMMRDDWNQDDKKPAGNTPGRAR